MLRRTSALILVAALGACSDDTPTSAELSRRVFSILGGIEVGEVLELKGSQVRDIALSGGGEYVIVPFYGSASEGTVRMEISFNGSNVQRPSAPARDRTSLALSGGDGARLVRDLSVHDRIRASEQALGPMLRAGARAAARSTSAMLAAEVPREGDLIQLNVNSRDACERPSLRAARVMAVSDRSIVVADVQNPAEGFTAADFRDVAIAFDSLIWKVGTRNFGTPADIDRNGRVIIFYTSTVNELTRPGMPGGYVGGYFYSRDLLPERTASGAIGCAGSNAAEIFYMLAPDPRGTINGNRFSRDQVRATTLSVTAHEFEHLINASRRIYENDAEGLEEPWLDEGLAHIAEEQVFYEASKLSPGSNLTRAAVTATPARSSAFDLFMLENLLRYWTYILNPTDESLLGMRADLKTRGAIWSFLRYAADRKGGSDEDFFMALANSRTAGLANLDQVIPGDPVDLMHHWAVSVYTDDLPGVQLAARFTQPSWNLRNLISSYNGGVYPLFVLPLSQTGIATVALKGGGSAFLPLRADEGRQGLVRTSADQEVPTDALRIAIVRTR